MNRALVLPPSIENHRAEMEALCQAYRVESLELFGSAARGSTDQAGDFDFLVRFALPHGLGYADRYLAFAESLEKLLGKPVDLLTERSLRNPILRSSIAPDRRIVYAA